METKEYKLLDGRIIRAKYDRLGRCNISKENLESFVNEFNASYRQAKILEKIKENYALMKADERKKGKWIAKGRPHGMSTPETLVYECSVCGREILTKYGKFTVTKEFPFCHCGADMESEPLLNYADQDTIEPAT